MSEKQQQREMTGVLFKNENRKTDRAPEYTGECTINGKLLRIAAWIKDGRKGKFMSIQFSEPQQQQRSGGRDSRDEDESRFF